MSHGARPVVVFGAGGQLGRELCRRLGGIAEPLAHDQLDITDTAAVRRLLSQRQPSAVFNAAAYTQVDRAECDHQRCWQVNAQAVEGLADVCSQLDCLLLQISTDYVFGGDSTRRTPYAEHDAVAPLNVYGESKVAGEEAARRWHKHLIVRTCGLYGRGGREPQLGRNFPETMLHLARRGQPLRVIDDQHCTPSFVPDVAAAIVKLWQLNCTGTFHITNSGETSWYRFAVELFRQAGLKAEISPILSDQYDAAATRPPYSVLNNGKYASINTSGQLPAWTDAIRRYLSSFA